jgi:hypothetical protein
VFTSYSISISWIHLFSGSESVTRYPVATREGLGALCHHLCLEWLQRLGVRDGYKAAYLSEKVRVDAAEGRRRLHQAKEVSHRVKVSEGTSKLYFFFNFFFVLLLFVLFCFVFVFVVVAFSLLGRLT